MMRSCYIVVLLVFILGCKKSDDDSIVNLNGGVIDTYGHAGTGFYGYNYHFPTNSMESIEEAFLVYGSTGVEVDIQLSADSVFFLYHDEFLNTATNGNGCIQDLQSNYIANCHYNLTYTENIDYNITVVPLSELLQWASTQNPQPDLRFDMRGVSFCTGINVSPDLIAEVLCSLVQEYNITSKIYIDSNNPTIVERMVSCNTDFHFYLGVISLDDGIPSNIYNATEGYIINAQSVEKEDIEKAHADNKKVTLFNVRERASCKEAIEMHPDGIISDNLPVLNSLLHNN